MDMIKRILMCNRGEISRRVQTTCREMGIEMVALYTEEEVLLPHVKEADFAVCLGSGPLAQTYLNQTLILELAKKYHCDAIHPGYGFLSENPRFARACEKAGLIFIGPSADIMDLMGDKQSSKKKMEELGIPLIPGYHGDDQDEKYLEKKAQEIGFPVLIKASAGGGGKGMRIVEKAQDFLDALEGAKREAIGAFGDDKVLIEKYILRPRHIEIQVFSDSHGNHLHLFERECSIQRRYQKIVEESPSVAMDENLRAQMTQAAVKITSSLNYLGAGTIEFMVDENKNFYFLEMNTRLQVEHPVTEMITGLDLVRWQILVAQGMKCPLTQDQIECRGHALEVRLYAEDPDNEFLPSIGKLLGFGHSHLRHWRLDSGYEAMNEITTQFDPMIAKLVVWGHDREEARHKMAQLLTEIGPLGLKTNREYLLRIMRNEAFIKGETTTDFVSKNQKTLGPTIVTSENLARALAVKILSAKTTSKEVVSLGSAGAWEQLQGFRLGERL